MRKILITKYHKNCHQSKSKEKHFPIVLGVHGKLQIPKNVIAQSLRALPVVQARKKRKLSLFLVFFPFFMCHSMNT
jgi:hypothetical protein